jgi:flagellar biogenesis protein FliO
MRHCFSAAAVLLALLPRAGWAAEPPLTSPALPDVSFSVLRLFGALALVLAIFLGGAWLFRNWQRIVLQKGRAPKLNVMEVRPLGNRHALYVIAYENQRMLLSSSPAGVSFLSHLPSVETGREEPEPAPSGTAMPFAQTLQQLLHRK